MSTFDAHEVFQMAVQIEKNGIEFYKAVQAVSPAETKKMFAFLAKEETKHLDLFQKCFESMASSKNKSINAEDYDYLKFLSDSHIFHPNLDITNFAKTTAPGELIRQAVQFEKDSILLFTELSKIVDERDRPAIEQIVQEEKRHLLSVYHIIEQL